MFKLIIKSTLLFVCCIASHMLFSQSIIDESLSPIRTQHIWYGDVQNAVGLRKNEGIIRIHNALHHEFRYGLSDNFSFGMNVSYGAFFDPFFTFINDSPTFLDRYAPPMTLNVEYKSYSNSLVNVAIGAELMGNTLTRYYRQITIGEIPRIYLVSTIGNHKNNITIKGGLNASLIVLDDVIYNNSINEVLWFGAIAGKCRLLDVIDFVGEVNIDTYDRYFFFEAPENIDATFYYAYRFAFRFYLKERWSLDFGVKDGNPDTETMPYLSFSFPLHFGDD